MYTDYLNSTSIDFDFMITINCPEYLQNQLIVLYLKPIYNLIVTYNINY